MPAIMGTIRASAVRTLGSRKAKRGRAAKPIYGSEGHCATTCSAPPASAPSAKARMGSAPRASNTAGRASAATMKATLRSPGAKAAATKRPYVLSAAMPIAAVPDEKDVREHPTGKRHRALESIGASVQPPCEELDQPWRPHHSEHGSDRKREQ